MARVNVEETIYASIPIIQTYTGWDYPTIIGHLVLLWRFSQECLRTSGTAEEVCDWAWVRKNQDEFIKGLVKAKFLRIAPCLLDDASSILLAPKSNEEPLYLIEGNQKHVQALAFFKERARKGAAARWSKVIEVLPNDASSIENRPSKPQKQPQIPDQKSSKETQIAESDASSIEIDASSMLNDASLMPNSIQCNSMQGKAKQSIQRNTKPRKKTSGAPSVPPPTNASWESYSDAFEKRWKTGPVRNATVNGQIAQILKRIPQNEVPALMTFYVKSDNPKYVKEMHKVGYLLMDCETVYAQMKGGIILTDTRNGYANGKAQQTMDLIEHNRRVKEDWVKQQKEKEKNEQHN